MAMAVEQSQSKHITSYTPYVPPTLYRNPGSYVVSLQVLLPFIPTENIGNSEPNDLFWKILQAWPVIFQAFPKPYYWSFVVQPGFSEVSLVHS